MTEDEAKKLVVGDVVLVRCMVERIGKDGMVILETLVGRAPVAASTIHSILPRPLAVGDRVKGVEEDAATGSLLALDGDWGWVLCDDDGEPCSYRLSELERAP